MGLKITKKKKICFLLFWPLGFGLFWSTASHPDVVEAYYTGLSKKATGILSLITGVLPFSLAEISFLLILGGGIVFLIRSIILEILHRAKGQVLGNYLLNFIIGLGIVYFIFVITWGLNYNRLSFAEIAGLKVEPASVQELEELCGKLIDRANRLRQNLPEDEHGVMTIPGGFSEVRQKAVLGFEEAASVYPELGGRFGKAKPVYFSRKMSYTGISGIYFPFTGEANVNVDIPHCLLPATTSHEMAHQRGFAREDEANYIAWVACSASPSPEFRYSGTLLALIHSMNALASHYPEKAAQLAQLYDEKVARDLRNLSEYWEKYEGKVEEIASDVNDAYLKSNRQEDGVRSYGRMVDLLLAEQKADPDKNFLKE